MNRVWFALVASAVLLTACEKQPGDIDIPGAQGGGGKAQEVEPPTAEELLTEMRKPLQAAVQLMQQNQIIPANKQQELVGQFRSACGRYSTTPNHPEAIERITQELTSAVERGAKQEQWHGVLLLINMYETRKPDSVKFRRVKQQAIDYINRPKVKITGFYDDIAMGKTLVFLDVFIPALGASVKVDPVVEGDEFLQPPYTMRLVQIIGTQDGITVEYKKTGEVWDVMDVIGDTKKRSILPAQAGKGKRGGRNRRQVQEEEEEEEDF